MTPTQAEKKPENTDNTANTGSTDNELNHLKEEAVDRIVEKMKGEDVSINFIGKKSIRKYLLENNKIGNFFIWLYLKIFSSSSKKLKELKEKIGEAQTRQDLDELERSLNDNPKIESHIPSPSLSEYSETVPDSAKVGEAKNIPWNERKTRLFPKGVPSSKEEMEKKYIVTVKVPIRTADGESKEHSIKVHKKLANEFISIFKEMYDKNIPVNPEVTGGFHRRLVRNGTSLSHHSYGSVVDLNRNVNGGIYKEFKTDPNSPYFNGKETVDIWKKHGFYWGGDRSRDRRDPMHFSYMEIPKSEREKSERKKG